MSKVNNAPEKKSNHFIVKKVMKIDDLKEGVEVSTSDYLITTEDKFIQMEYIYQKREKHTVPIEPGVFTAQYTQSGLKLFEASLKNDDLLDEFDNTKEISDKIDCFMRNKHIYKELGRKDVRRNILLYGPPGTGKTSSISKVVNKYLEQGDTAVLIWKTDVVEPDDIKTLVGNFEYKGVKNLIFLAEDIGGVEAEDARINSKSSLLSLLDNQDNTFTIPTVIIATTNFPQMFLENIANRPQRFDDKIKVGYPTPEMRRKLFEFFGKERVNESDLDYVEKTKFDNFTPAHIQEIIIRSVLYEMSIKEVMDGMLKEIELYSKGYDENKRDIGISYG